MLSIIANMLDEEQIKYVEINGKTPINYGAEIVNNFNMNGCEKVRLDLVQTTALGIILNLFTYISGYAALSSGRWYWTESCWRKSFGLG